MGRERMPELVRVHAAPRADLDTQPVYQPARDAIVETPAAIAEEEAN